MESYSRGSVMSFNSFGGMKKGNHLSHGRQKKGEKPFVRLRIKSLRTDCAEIQMISPNQ